MLTSTNGGCCCCCCSGNLSRGTGAFPGDLDRDLPRVLLFVLLLSLCWISHRLLPGGGAARPAVRKERVEEAGDGDRPVRSELEAPGERDLERDRDRDDLRKRSPSLSLFLSLPRFLPPVCLRLPSRTGEGDRRDPRPLSLFLADGGGYHCCPLLRSLSSSQPGGGQTFRSVDSFFSDVEPLLLSRLRSSARM